MFHFFKIRPDLFFFYMGALVSLFFSSCLTQRQVEYLQDKSSTVVYFEQPGIEVYRSQPNDDVLIQISSLDDLSSNVFAGTNAQQSPQVGAIDRKSVV